MQALPSHSHADLTWHWRCTKARFVLTVLDVKQVKMVKIVGKKVQHTSRMKTGRPRRGLSDSSLTARMASS